MTIISLELSMMEELSRKYWFSFPLVIKETAQREVAKVRKKLNNGWPIRVSEFYKMTITSYQMTLIGQCARILTFDYSRSGHSESSDTISRSERCSSSSATLFGPSVIFLLVIKLMDLRRLDNKLSHQFQVKKPVKTKQIKTKIR